jgi:hypothetical protein
MPTNRYVLRRSSRAKLTGDQELELWLGVGHRGTAFESDEHRRALWFYHRARLMQWFAKNGKRPMGWWLYESPFRSRRHPGAHHLYEFSDALSADERVELEAFWRKEFDKTWREGFSCYHEGRIFTGDIAREYHWLWADIPPPYLDKLMAERERRGQVIRELEEESQQGDAVGGNQ